MEPVRYEWDEAKRVENLGSTASTSRQFTTSTGDMAVSSRTDRRDYGEARFVAYRLRSTGGFTLLVYTRPRRRPQDHQLQKGQPP